MSNARMTDDPHDRLTRLCDEMVQPLGRAENDDVRAVVMLSDPEHGGMVMTGYDDATDAWVDVFTHLAAIFEVQGKKLMLMSEDGTMML